MSDDQNSANVPVIRGMLYSESLRLLPNQSAQNPLGGASPHPTKKPCLDPLIFYDTLIHVELEDSQDLGGPILLESNLELVEAEKIQLESSM